MAHDKNILDELDMDLSGDYGAGEEGFSLESILAEYKGSAFMDGDRRTPAEELQRKTDAILREAMGGAAEPEKPESRPEARPEAAAAKPEEDGEEEERPRRRRFFSRRDRREDEDDWEDEPEEAEEPPRALRRHSVPVEPVEPEPEPAYETAPEIDLSVFEEPEEPKSSARDDFLESIRREPFVTDVSPDLGEEAYAAPGDYKASKDLPDEEPEEPARKGLFAGLFGRRRDEEDEDLEDDELDEGYPGQYEEPMEDYGDEEYLDVEPDPDFKAEAARYASYVPIMRFRIWGVTVLTALVALVTFLFAGGHHPFGIERDASAVAVVAILELVAMGLGLDVLIRGVEDILKLSPGTESLVFVSCAMSVVDALTMLAGGRFGMGLPMALVSCVSLLGAMSSRKSMYMAYCDTLKAASASTSAYGVTVDTESMAGSAILKKVTGETEGFYTKLTTPDAGESFYDDMAPLLVIVAFVLSFLATVGHGNAAGFAHSFSILTAVAAAFPAAQIFALPFKFAASNLRKVGAAIAGFQGAEDVYYADGALITDLDIFPVGSVSMSGVKIFEGMDAQKVIAYTASLIVASDSGLRKVFEEALVNQGLTRKRVDDFACYDGGGIGGLVEGQRVLVGTGAFMSLMGLRVPENLNVQGSVFTAVNDELAGVFALNYVPSNSVQSALVALLGTRTNLMMAVRDFNVTPNTVTQKFKVSMDGVGYLPVETTYELSQDRLSPGEGVSAFLARSGLAPFAEVITRGRLLKLITNVNTWVTGVGTAMAMIIMFFLCWTGAFASATAGNIFLFMSVIGLAVYIISQGTRKRMK